MPILRQTLRLACHLLLICLMALPAAAQQVRKTDVVRVLQRLHELPGIEQGYKEAGFDDERVAIMLDHTRQLMANKSVVNFVADQVINAQIGRPNTNQLGGVVQPLIDRGLPHLPLKDQLYFLNVETTVIRALSTANCGRVMKETINPETFSRDNNRVIARLNTPALREYLRILRKATTLGVLRSSPPRISTRARTQATDRYFNAVLLRAQTEKLMPQLERSAVNMRSLSNKDACRLGLMFVDVVMDYDGPDKKTMLQVFLLGFE